MATSPRIKFGVDPAPVPLHNGEHHNDNLQDLIQRKREIQKNKHKYHLSEADCNLLLTNAREFHYADNQVIVQEGQELHSVYRIKYGKVNIVKGGRPVSVIAQGWFLGETLFLNGRSCVYDASLMASGTVTIAELNLSFVRRMFEVDHTLALKFYRTLASKLSSVHYALLGHLLGLCLVGIGNPLLSEQNMLNPFSIPFTLESTSASDSSSSEEQPPSPSTSSTSSSSTGPSTSSTSSTSSAPSPSAPSSSFSATSSVGSLSTGNPPIASIVSNAAALSKCPNLPDSFLLEVINQKKTRQLTKRQSQSSLHAAFKTYKLESGGKGSNSVKLKLTKMNIMSEAFGFKHKTSIEYNKIKNVVKTNESSVTVIYEPFVGKTLFFRTAEDAEEFFGLSTSLAEAGSLQTRKPSSGVPISSPKLAISDRPANSEEHYEDLKALMKGLATRLELRKGDFVMQEGDLYQRIYSIVSGEVHAELRGVKLNALREGDMIGLPTLLHLRPCPTNLIVSSDTATIWMLPAYKIIDLSKNNIPLAARLYKRTAITLQAQVERLLCYMRGLAAEAADTTQKVTPAQRRLRGDSRSFEAAMATPPPSPPSSPPPLRVPLSTIPFP